MVLGADSLAQFGHIFGGWQVNGILTLRKGFPTDLRYPTNPPVFNTANRPNRVLGVPAVVDHPGFDQYFNPAAFAAPPKVPDVRGNLLQTFGNAGRSILRGPGSRNLDLSLFKEFRMTEKTMLQFRAEAFNASNTPTFTLPTAVSRGACTRSHDARRDRATAAERGRGGPGPEWRFFRPHRRWRRAAVGGDTGR